MKQDSFQGSPTSDDLAASRVALAAAAELPDDPHDTQRATSPCLTPDRPHQAKAPGTPQGLVFSLGSTDSRVSAAPFDTTDQIGAPPPQAALVLLQAGERVAPVFSHVAIAGEKVGSVVEVGKRMVTTVPEALRRDLMLAWWSLLGFSLCFTGLTDFWGLVVLVEALLLCGAREVRDHLRHSFGWSSGSKKSEAEQPSRDLYESQLNSQLGTPAERARQRVDAFFSAVRDPDKIPYALRNLLLLSVGVTAAVRWQTMRDIVLGCGVARHLRRPCGRAVVSVAYHVIPDRHQRWLTVATDTLLIVGFVAAAWVGLHNGALAACAALRGAPLLVTNFTKLLRVRGLVTEVHLNAARLAMLEHVLAVAGLITQLSVGLASPVVLMIVLFPAHLLSVFVQGL
eukprot:Hpha_TRINITY_DN16236_c2_g3::TRINITY_DN16236_c2_g3_i6::g.14673::m.14673